MNWRRVSTAVAVIVASSCLGCGGGAQVKSPRPANVDMPAKSQAPAQADKRWLHFTRSPCYGSCPVYSVDVDADGMVRFQGEMYVVHKGPATKQLSPEERRNLEVFLAQPFLHSLKVDCCNCMEWTDHAGFYMEVFDRERPLKIDHYHGCTAAPRELFEVEERLEKLIGVGEWVGSRKRRAASP